MKDLWPLALATILLLGARSFADDTKDSELKMLRETVKKQNESLEPLRAKVRSHEKEIERINSEAITAKKEAADAAKVKEDLKKVTSELQDATKQLQDLRQKLLTQGNQLSEALARLKARSATTSNTTGGTDPIKEEFVSSFQKFVEELEPAYRDAHKQTIEKLKDQGFSGSISNFSSDVIATDSAMYPLQGVIKVSCSQLHSSDVTARFARVNGAWKLIEASRKTTKVTGSDSLGKDYSRDAKNETDYSKAPVLRAAVIAAHGVVPKDEK